MEIYDLRAVNNWATFEHHLSHSFGHQPLLLAHCTAESWEQVAILLKNIAPQTLEVVAMGGACNELTETVPVENVTSLVHVHSVLHLLIPVPSSQSLDAVGKLVDIVATLRSPNGCPWDRAQTPLSLTPYILEEAYEAVAAIRSHDIDHTVEELGDLLLQVVLQSQVFSESGDFTLADVADGISTKLIRRHPHVFGPDATGSGTDIADVKQRWDEIKQEEKAAETLHDKLVGYAATFPPLLAATKIAKKTSSIAGKDENSTELLQSASEQMDVLQELLAGGSSTNIK